ncbi:MAG: choline/carnitine O-acyltransferase [Acidobacteriaceae bacterium]|nr:choline/carnitine O-acyltransferase [Acidobacteriaceae bacterium]
MPTLDPRERTRLLYEDVPGCPSPAFFDPAALHDVKAFQALGVTLNSASNAILKAAHRLGTPGVRQASIQHLLRTVNLRNNYFAPVMSATAAIEDHPSAIDPLHRAAALVAAARAMYLDIVSGNFPPDRYGAAPLEMGQYPNLFSTNIIHDGQHFCLFKSTLASQVTVLRSGHLYSLSFEALPAAWPAPDVLSALLQIPASNAAIPAALISAAKPSTQARAWAELRNHPTGAPSLDSLRHSFLTLCLDLDLSPSSAAEAAALAQSGNPGNRWFNSALQIVVFGNSKACLLFNFNAYLDGNVQMRAASEISKRAVTVASTPTAAVNPTASTPEELPLPVPPALLARAAKDLAGITHTQQSTFELPGFGRAFFSSRGLDPVPAFVAALQLAVFRLTGRFARIRQLLAMSKYRSMDLVTASVSTRQMLDFIECMRHPSCPRELKQACLGEAIASQTAVCRAARRYFPAFRAQMLLAEKSAGIRRAYIRAVVKIAKLLLRALGLAHFGREDILISHPAIYKEVPIIGRPGICLPYLRYFGVHYQILDSSITLTWMPSTHWNIPTTALTQALADSLNDMAGITDP